MPGLKRPLTLCFQLPRGRVTEEDVLNALAPNIQPEAVLCIQVTPTESFVTVKDEASRSNLMSRRKYNINGKPVRLQVPGLNITRATIKDAPVELPDDVILEALSTFGRVLPDRLRTGTLKSTSILTGTRYVDISDVEKPIPTDIDIEDYPVRIFCNNGKTACRHCGDTSHPSLKCLIRPRSEKKCFRCFSVSHMIDQCPNDVVCRHCG